MYEPVNGFVGGRPATGVDSSVGIEGTDSDALYRTGHVGMSAFQRRADPGSYQVTLRMAELYWDAAGKRIFDVSAEGAPVLAAVDIHGAVGKHAAYDRTFEVEVSDGTLDIGFHAVANLPLVSAITIVPMDHQPSATASLAAASSTTGATRPNAQNTGVPDGTVLTRHQGDLVITEAGAHYDALDVHGFVVVQAPDVTITRSRIRGGVARHNTGLVEVTSSRADNLLIEDSEMAPAHPSVWIDGIKGSGFTARRVDISGTVDFVKVHGDDVRVEASWLHDARYFASDPNQGGGPTHNDGVQVLGGRNIRVLGNSVSGAQAAALQVTQDFSATTDLQFSGNWVDGGMCSVNLAHKPRSSMSGITVTGNRFGRNTRVLDCSVLSSTMTTLVAERNVWQDTGLPVRVRRNG